MNSKSAVFWVLAFVLLAINFIGDIFELLINLFSLIGIGVITMFLNFVIDPVIGGITFLILIIMGGLSYGPLAKRLIAYAIGFISEFIPVIDILPLRTITVVIAIILMIKEDKDKFREEENSKQFQREEENIEELREKNRTIQH